MVVRNFLCDTAAVLKTDESAPCFGSSASQAQLRINTLEPLVVLPIVQYLVWSYASNGQGVGTGASRVIKTSVAFLTHAEKSNFKPQTKEPSGGRPSLVFGKVSGSTAPAKGFKTTTRHHKIRKREGQLHQVSGEDVLAELRATLHKTVSFEEASSGILAFGTFQIGFRVLS